MIEHLTHALLHKAIEAIGESGMGKKVGESIDNMLDNGYHIAEKAVKQTGHVIKKSVSASSDGIAAAVKSYKNQK